MKKPFLLFILLVPTLLFSQVSIYDIQYTTDLGPDGWSYPSPYNGQSVNTGGIVTAIDYMSGQYFIESSPGGPWSGVFIYDNNYSPSIGDSIYITGTVYEYQGYTEIKNLTSYSTISSGNTLPPTTQITTDQVDWESNEGVLVELNNCHISAAPDATGNLKIDNGSGECDVSTGFYSLTDSDFPLVYNYPFEKIIGLVGINDWEGKVHPRSIDDFVSAADAFVLGTDDKFVLTTETFSYPVTIGILNRTNTITSYSLKLQYDKTKFQFQGFTKTGTLSESGTITDASTAGNIELNFTGNISCNNVATLINLEFSAISEGDANMQFNSPTINGSTVNYLSAGSLAYGSDPCDIPIGDTLTIVQRPLLNIPSIVLPGQQMDIECFAPETTIDWAIEIFYDDISVSLPVNQANYDSGLDKWTLTTTIPSVDLYELYDMRVSASGGLVDTVTNSVKVIDQFKTDYYFIHITDIHLLGHTFYGESGYATDQTEMDDFYEVIKDINLLNPEFVLLTGDLINEGELEDFECLRNHTLTVQLLEELEVPVYIVPGNHDLGGWDETPPEQGTARNEWWRFFGWRQREVPPTESTYQSHDYSFDYGNVHFTGLEAYDNYDSYMYDVYGQYSFTSEQLTWLNQDLAAAGDKTKVLFYHYDFKNEIDLSALGVDMALWGHTHLDSDDSAHPYDISTASVCDNNRRYRVIRVNNGSLQAEGSVSTHSGSSDLLTISYNNTNDGTEDMVSATIQNNHSLSFDHGLVKFTMPTSEFGYEITNGRLRQIKDNGSTAVCYVEVSLPANGQIITTVLKKTESNITSIYEIQYTTNAGDGTYPSELNNQNVTTGGIVTATNYLGGNFFISSSVGGAWNGILVYDENYSPSIGDSVLISGKVSEYEGYTELVNLTSLQIINSGNNLPEATLINANQINNEEYEGVYAQINNSLVTTGFDEYGNFSVNDGNGACIIGDGMYSLMNDGFVLLEDYHFESIRGIIAYFYGSNAFLPRSLADIQASSNGFILLTENKSINNYLAFSYPVNLSIIQTIKEINNYTLKIQYNSDVFHYEGYDKSNTVSAVGSISDNSSEGNIELVYSGTTSLEKTDTLIKVKFSALSEGLANIQFNGTIINSNNLLYSKTGDIESTIDIKSIYDIQYTTDAGDGSYPSALTDQSVTTGGIVTATNYFGGNFFISSSQGGAWNGILVYDDSYTPEIGDSVLLTGTVSEYNGYTELTDLTSFEVISSGNPLPNPEPVNTANIINEEYEGVLIQVNNCNVTEGFDSYGMIKVDDSSGECDIRTGIYNLMDENFTLIDDYEFSQITGVIGINAGHNSIHPRSLNDFQAANNGFILITEDESVDHNNEFNYPVQISFIKSSKDITNYSLQTSYSEDVFEYMGYDKTNTLSASGTITDESTAGEIELNYTGSTTLVKSDTLIRLKFKALTAGSANLQFNASTFNSNNLIYSEIGDLQSTYESTTSLNQIGTENNLTIYPNPFKDELIIEYNLEETAFVQLFVYNMAGQLVNMLVNENKQPGSYKAIWNASDLSDTKIDAGTYIYRFTLDGKNASSGQVVYMK